MKTPPLVASLNLQLRGVKPTLRLAGNMLLGLELDFIKRERGYGGGGSWWAYRDDIKSGERPLWGDFCRDQAGITEDSARNFMECVEALKQRCRWAGSRLRNAPRVRKLLGKQPSTLSEAMRAELTDLMSGMLSGSTQVVLRKEFRAAKPTPEELREVEGLSKKEAAEYLDMPMRMRVGTIIMEQALKPVKAKQGAVAFAQPDENKIRSMMAARLALQAHMDREKRNQSV